MLRSPVLHILILLCISFTIFFPVLGNDFLYYWDDQWMVINDFTEGGFTYDNLCYLFTSFYYGQYSPFTELSYILVYTICGYNPFGFHLLSVLIHGINACLAYMILRHLLAINGKIRSERIPAISFLTAVFFVVHPLAVESVAWISASKVLLYAFFYLCATYSYISYLNKNKFRYYIFTLFLFTCSFLSKEQAVIFPLWIVLLNQLYGRSFRLKETWWQMSPFFLLALIFGLFTLWAQALNGTGILQNEVAYPLWQRLVFGCYAFFEYLFKSVFPVNLLYIYPFPSIIGEPLPNWILIYPALLLIILACLWKYICRGVIGYGLLFFTIHLLFTLHIIPISRFAIIADRYAYLSLLGIGFILSYYFVRFYHKINKSKRKVSIVVLCLFIIYLSVYSNRRSRVWHNTDTLKSEIRELLKQRNDYLPE